MPQSESSLAAALAAYVPRILVERLASGKLPPIGQAERLDGVALFADLSGFAPLPERLAAYGQAGAGVLTTQLDAIFSKLIYHVHSYGGTVVGFGGDALMAVFMQDEAPKLAVSCALMMQAEIAGLGPRKALGETFTVSIKIGLGRGALALAHVGHAAQESENPEAAWREVIFAGEAIDRATASAQHAARGDIVADPAMAAALGGVLTGQRLDAGFVLVEDVLPLAPPEQLPPPLASSDVLRPYLLTPILRRLEAGEGHPPADLRCVTSLFVTFHGMDYRAANAGEQLQSYVSQAGDIIRQHDGSLIAILTGDEGGQLHVVFGAPLARENIEQRALNCALALVALGSPGITGQQIGVASGRALAGPLGSEARREYALIGDAVNLSSHLAALAAPGQILLDEATYRRALEAFDAEARPNVRIKGQAQPQTVYRLKGVRTRKSALAARYLLSKRGLLGRDAEVAQIGHVIERALAGEGQVLALSGDAGIGKSRLVEEVIRLWLPHGQGFGGGCPPHAPSAVYIPWISIWRDILLPGTSSDETACLAALRERLAALCPDYPEAPALLGPALGVETETHPGLATLDAKGRQDRLFEVVTALLHNLAREKPLMLVFSDLHWSDGPSRRLIEHVACHSADVSLLLCLDHRPREALLPGLDDLDCLTRLELRPLSGEAGWRLVDEMTHDMPHQRWPEALRAELENHLGITHDTVIPLSVEETVNALIQSRVLIPEDGSYRVEAGRKIDIPNSVQDILMARIDVFDEPSRDLLGVASVVASPFALPVLLEAYPQTMSEAEMVERLDELEALDMLVTTGREPARTYSFRHGLMEEVIYNSLPFARQRDWHARVGQVLESSPAADTNVAVLARHFDLGEQADKAARYSLQAGEQAQELSDYALALEHYHTALRHLAELPPEDAWSDLVSLRLRRGRVFLEQGRFAELQADIQEVRRLASYHDDLRRVVQAGVLDAERCYWEGDFAQMARVAGATAQLAAEEEHREELADALRLQGFALQAMGRSDEALGALATALDLARELENRAVLSKVINSLAMVHFSARHIDEALDYLEKALSLAREARDKPCVGRFLANKGVVLTWLGRHDEAKAALREALDIFTGSEQLLPKAYTLNDLGALHCMMGEYEEGQHTLSEAARVFAEQGDEDGQAWLALTISSQYDVDVGDLGSARLNLTRGVEAMRASEYHEALLLGLLPLARVCMREGSHDEAAACLEEAQAVIDEHGLDWHRPTLACQQAELALARGEDAAARQAAEKAIAALAQGGNPYAGTVAYRLLALSCRDTSPDEVAGLFEKAITLGRQQARRIELAQTLEAAGDWLVAQPNRKRQQRGKKLLDEAAAIYAAIGLSAEEEHRAPG